MINTGGHLPLFIGPQNAGVIISASDSDILFRAFELSPTNESVMSTKGRLQRTFPSCAVAVTRSTFFEKGFVPTVASIIAKLSSQAAPGMQATVRKAGQKHQEDRETSTPAMVVEFLVSFLRAAGRPERSPPVFWKNTREEVMWADALLPWRRSPVWLLARVAMQLACYDMKTCKEPQPVLYKTFMVFLMAHILQFCHKHDFPSDILHVLMAKISRRLLKLGINTDKPYIAFIRTALLQAHETIKGRWQQIMDQSSPRLDLTRLTSLAPREDTPHHLPELDEFIAGIAKRKGIQKSSTFKPGPVLPTFSSDDLPTLFIPNEEDYKVFSLTAFETWIELHLGKWLNLNVYDAMACTQLRNLMQDYHRRAVPMYQSNPESYSNMVLNIMELWVACDKSACHLYYLLPDYDPEIPIHLLQCLLLPFRSQMDRLFRIEKYLEERRTRLWSSRTSIFHSFGTPCDFSVRYFNTSHEHQSLLSGIEETAQRRADEKRKELNEKQEEYQNLMQQYYTLECEYDEDEEHIRSCCRCTLKKQADDISIEVFEDPLPEDTYKRKATVFELNPPSAFGSWRDATVYMQQDVLRSNYTQSQSPHAQYSLHGYKGLREFTSSISLDNPRISLLSEVKPHINTHRCKKRIPHVTESDVCVKNGLRLQYYDNAKGVFVITSLETEEMTKLCMYRLENPDMQKFLRRVPSEPKGLPPNQVMASQSECPADISLEEFRAYCSLPLGCQIQWMNILRQLASPSLGFKKVETHLLFLQVMYQSGPPGYSQIERPSHLILTSEEFTRAFMHELKNALHRVSESWESAQAVACLMHTAARMLSLVTTSSVKDKLLEYLANGREIAFNWIRTLGDKAQQSAEDSQKTDFLSKMVETALICTSTFDVEPEHLGRILASPAQASLLIHSSITIQQFLRTAFREKTNFQAIMVQRWKTLLYRVLPILSKEVTDGGNSCLDIAIKESWPAYQAGGPWEIIGKPHHHWISCYTKDVHLAQSSTVHFNFLTAELLVDGSPLARLPAHFEDHPTYRALFGKSALEVMPSRIPGMKFSTQRLYAGYTLHLGEQAPLDNPSTQSFDILVHAFRDGREYNLVPAALLRNKVPAAFLNNFIHWYDHAGNSIEFRPRHRPWESSDSIWRLFYRVDSSWLLERKNSTLVSCTSRTARVLSGIFSSIEDLPNVHILCHTDLDYIEIELPRLKLGFDWKVGTSTILSRQFRGMSIDATQDVETLLGLRTKLLLKSEETNKSRLMIIPKGDIVYYKSTLHVTVTIDIIPATGCHTYSVDPILGRLVDDGDLQSKLFVCYLHSITSYCLPDPLTGRTGTEQALLILGSGAVRSFACLTRENHEILDHLAKVTPKRACYPRNKRLMQSVDWKPEISFLSQHGSFFKLVRTIFDQAGQGEIFKLDAYIAPPVIEGIDPFLVERDLIRSSTFRVDGFGAEHFTTKHDREYTPRDRNQDSSGAVRALTTAYSILRGQPVLSIQPPAGLLAKLWDFLQGCGEIELRKQNDEAFVPKFDFKWLEKPGEVVAPLWCTIQSLFSGLQKGNKFQIGAWLSAMAFSDKAEMEVIEVFSAFYNVPGLATQNALPPYPSYRLSNGIKPNSPELYTLVRSFAKSFHSCPEASLPRHYNETVQKYKNRKSREFQSNQNQAIRLFVTRVESSWPCEIPSRPVETTINTYLEADRAYEKVNLRFMSWFHNLVFHNYLSSLVRDLHTRPVVSIHIDRYLLPICYKPVRQDRVPFVTTQEIFAGHAPTLPLNAPPDIKLLVQHEVRRTPIEFRLQTLLNTLETHAQTSYEINYVKDLHESLACLGRDTNEMTIESSRNDIFQSLLANLDHWQAYVHDLNSAIYVLFGGERQTPRSLAYAILQAPRVSPILFLQQLTRKRWEALTYAWRACLIGYGSALIQFQRAERLVRLVGNDVDLINELANPGHQNWNPQDFPESFLLEIESGLIIREKQEDIAREMREPSSSQNSVMQLNMGEGKSTVIVPIVGAMLANGTKLVRVIVAKPQSKQMLQILVSRLGGLLDRQIYHMPFSRSLKLDVQQISAIAKMCRECMVQGGILLVQPEHILSFRLMGLDQLINGNESIGKSLLATQHFFDEKSRDVIDESDENFGVKFELVYTMGTQGPIELSPGRWRMIPTILRSFASVAFEVKSTLQHSIEINEQGPGRFPRIRLLRADAEQKILQQTAQRICQTNFEGVPIANQSREIREAVFTYITKPELDEGEIAMVEKSSIWTDATRGPLLLIRGLIAGGILCFAFGSKRWRVNYGLDPYRIPSTRLAVPFRAKDNPSLRSEFSHPDVSIILTLLSYYYGGLEDDQLVVAFEHLLKSDQAQNEYSEWTRYAPSLPSNLRQIVSINLKDRAHCVEKVFPHLRYSTGAVDYFLSFAVFAKEMKEFPHKISASGWDLGELKSNNVTTGFSGTNDSRYILPLSVAQLDLPAQKHTNALVLEYLLQDLNSVKILPNRDQTTETDAEVFLASIATISPPVRVVLDVGAQILELSNLEFARKWLASVANDSHTKAAVFFDDDDELCVLDRKDQVEKLQTSPFAKQLDLCLVFLDESHTRGTDLRFPIHYRAAVTLGANLTKDKLVQGTYHPRFREHVD